MSVKNEEVAKVEENATKAPEMIEKAKFDELVKEYQKLATAFNKLLKEFNDLHMATLFSSEDK